MNVINSCNDHCSIEKISSCFFVIDGLSIDVTINYLKKSFPLINARSSLRQNEKFDK